MTVAPVGIPSASVPLLDGDGLSNPWRRFFESLWRRLGGFQEISVAATSNTNLQFSYRGSDGVVRTGNLTLS